jgi:hypothetical protein
MLFSAPGTGRDHLHVITSQARFSVGRPDSIVRLDSDN